MDVIQIIVGLVGLIACSVPALRDTPLIWCASWACGNFLGRGIAKFWDRPDKRHVGEQFREFVDDIRPDRAG